MRVFMISKKMIKIYGIVALGLVGLYVCGNNLGDAVFTAGSSKEIPIYCVDRDDKKISLTFDAAWDAEDTDELIGILKENGVSASFFTVGGWVNRFPDAVKKFYDNGHEILNHSDTHAHMANLTAEQVATELNECENKIQNITGVSYKLFRAPYGEYNDGVIKAAREAGYTTIQWDVDSLDWKELTAEEISKRVISKSKGGSIILMHNGAENTPAALRIILPALKEKGFEFVPVSQLIYKEQYHIDSSGKQIKD